MSQGAGFNSRTTQYIHHQITVILVQPCWDLFHFHCFVRVCMNNVSPVIEIGGLADSTGNSSTKGLNFRRQNVQLKMILAK